ncbi:MAG: caspase family protein [Gammaproteobacteria bacterium]
MSYSDPRDSVPGSVVRTVVDSFAERLDSLGDNSFKTTKILGATAHDARRRLQQAVREAGRAEALLLVYYFGHGVLSEKDELLLFFRDSQLKDFPSMLKLGDVVEWMRYYKVPRAVFILDCCYSGAVQGDLHVLREYRGKYFVMAAATPLEKARIDYGDNQPYGIF